MIHQPPPIWRVVAGFVIAPLFAAAVMAVSTRYEGGLDQVINHFWGDTLLIASVGAYPATAMFGIPIYLLLNQTVAPRLIWSSVAGAVIASIPWLILILLGPKPDSASIDNIPTVVNGSKTAYGWMESGKFLLGVAALGGVGSLVFWLIVVPRRRGIAMS